MCCELRQAVVQGFPGVPFLQVCFPIFHTEKSRGQTGKVAYTSDPRKREAEAGCSTSCTTWEEHVSNNSNNKEQGTSPLWCSLSRTFV